MSTLKKLAEKRRVVEDVDPEDADAAYDALPVKRKDGEPRAAGRMRFAIPVSCTATIAVLARHFAADARRKPAGGADVAARSKLRADAEVANLATDPKYAGRVVSLKELRRQQDDDEEDEDDEAGSEDDEAEDDDDGSDGSNDDDDDDDDDGDDDVAPARSRAAGAAAGAGDGAGGGRGLIGDVDAELAALESADASQMVQLARAANDDAKKGKDVRHQNVRGAPLQRPPTSASGPTRAHTAHYRYRCCCCRWLLSR